ncbi:MAG: type VII toxin-antitoxin system HepT family RNase toxin [Gammaproteobacteria bacterium]
MDKLILQEKLEALRNCIRRVETRRTRTADELRTDPDRQDIIALNLTRAVQLCVDMATYVIADSDEIAPQTMGQAFEALARLGVIDMKMADRMKAAVGFRNIAVHNYREIDWDIVFAITHQGLDDFRDFAVAVTQLL